MKHFKAIGALLTIVGTIVYGGLVTRALRDELSDIFGDEYKPTRNRGYYDAVNAIMKSDMWDFYKQEAISSLKRDGSAEMYTTVITIIDSDMWEYQKLNMIKEICSA